MKFIATESFLLRIVYINYGEDGGAGGDLLNKGMADDFFTKPFSLENRCKTLVEKPPPAQ